MRLLITDEFLWNLYRALEKAEDFFYFFSAKPWREVAVPPSLSLRRLYEKRKGRQNFESFLRYLKRSGYIKIKSLEPKGAVIITKKGMEKILRISLKKTEKKRRKDGKWIMLIFDIPERLRKLRDLFRRDLQVLDFQFFQKSIWVCPYDVLEALQKLVQRYDLEKYVRIFLIEEVELKEK